MLTSKQRPQMAKQAIIITSNQNTTALLIEKGSKLKENEGNEEKKGNRKTKKDREMPSPVQSSAPVNQPSPSQNQTKPNPP